MYVPVALTSRGGVPKTCMKTSIIDPCKYEHFRNPIWGSANTAYILCHGSFPIFFSQAATFGASVCTSSNIFGVMVARTSPESLASRPSFLKSSKRPQSHIASLLTGFGFFGSSLALMMTAVVGIIVLSARAASKSSLGTAANCCHWRSCFSEMPN